MKQPNDAVRAICGAWHRQMRKALAEGDFPKVRFYFAELRYWRARRFAEGEQA